MIRQIQILTLFFLLIFTSCNYNSSSGNAKLVDNPELISTLNQGKSFVDSQLLLFLDEYNKLCELKHNDQLKEKYSILQSKILRLNEIGYQLPGLASSEQIELVKYTTEKIKANVEISALAYSGNISCW